MADIKADKAVPSHIQRLAHYFHSLIEIWEYYRAIGSSLPKPFEAEMQRAKDELESALEVETNQGGSLHAYYREIKS